MTRMLVCHVSFERFHFLFRRTKLVQFITIEFSNIQFQWLQEMNGWALYGIINYAAHNFILLYQLKYGVGNALAQFDRIEPMPLPKCFSCLHLHSRIARSDRALHEFLKELVFYYKLCYYAYLLYTCLFFADTFTSRCSSCDHSQKNWIVLWFLHLFSCGTAPVLA